MKNKLLLLSILFSLIYLQACKEEDVEINSEQEFEEFLEEEMDLEAIPALSVLIFEDEAIRYEKHLGYSSLTPEKKLTSADPFLMASVSKVITATALLQLHDQGLFKLDDEINDYLPFKVEVPGYATPLTFRMLLTHTSGIADGSALDGEYYYGKDSPTPLAEFLENYLKKGGSKYNETDNFYDFEPGTEHEYSNVGSALIGVLVEQISGKEFNAYCKENIFNPLGMNNTFWRLDEAKASGLSLVKPYNFDGRNFEAIEHYTFTDYPNGGLRSTARDMAIFFAAFVQGGTTKNVQLLKSETVTEMLRPQLSFNTEVGLHLFLMNSEKNLWGHDGGEQGVATMVAFNRSTKLGVIILANEGEANLDLLLKEAYEYAKSLN